MKYSRQRELIREIVEHSDSHPTADMVYQQVKKLEPTISLATVYRNLHQLADHQMLRKITVPGDSDRFDKTLADHEHMICTKCKCVVDIFPSASVLAYFQSMQKIPQVQNYDLILYGLCESCMKQE